jgi:hypothetical protein
MALSYRSIAWEHGCFAVQNLAAMVGPATFVLRDGRQVQPLQIAPWTFEPGVDQLPPVLRKLRGEWPCVPFGSDADRRLPAGWAASGETFDGADVLHGPGSNEEWRFVESSADTILLALDYPSNHPVKSLARRVWPDPAAPALNFELEIVVRRPCALPIGLHPTFRLPRRPGAFSIEDAAYDYVRTFPGTVDEETSIFAQDARFSRLEQAPTRDGRNVDASTLPFDGRVEDLLMLVNCAGSVTLRNAEDKWRAKLTWNRLHFPCLQLWISNRGRAAYPWNGRHLGIGVEPVCAAFDLGPATSTAQNPIAADGVPTAIRLSPDEVFVTRYRLEMSAG